ncbi:MAG: pilin, partial [Rhodocyclaceae bacterium]
TGKYVETITAAPAGTNCQLEATFKMTGVSDKLAGKKLRFTYNPANGNWVCTSDIGESIRPKTCTTPL